MLQAGGNIEYLCRIDQQVKIRGFRIEMGEIESVLETYPGVRQSVVLVCENHPGDKRLVAYIVCTNENGVTRATLRAHASQMLPHYMVPSEFVFLPKLPITANGKVDRKTLSALAGVWIARQEKSYVGPSTENERRMVQIWEDVLHTSPVSLSDNFFEVGGHSLMAARLTTRVRGEFGIDLPLIAIMDAPTIPLLLAKMELAHQSSREQLSSTQLTQVGPIPRVSEDERVLSFGQERLWLIQMFAPSSSAYNIANAFRLTGPLNVERFCQALNLAIARHEVLRTRIVRARRGRPGAILDNESPRVRVHDLQTTDVQTSERLVDDLLQVEAQRPFKLDRDAMCRALLINVNHDEHVLSLVFHHSAADGWSISGLLKDMKTAYLALESDENFGFPDLPIQYSDFAAWQRNQLTAELLGQ